MACATELEEGLMSSAIGIDSEEEYARENAADDDAFEREASFAMSVQERRASICSGWKVGTSGGAERDAQNTGEKTTNARQYSTDSERTQA
jgi:hypothetical protein